MLRYDWIVVVRMQLTQIMPVMYLFELVLITFLIAGLFLCVFLIARRHASNHFTNLHSPQSSGYELACQDDLTPAAGDGIDEDEDNLVTGQGHADDEEDEDDFELASGTDFGNRSHSQRGLMRLRSSSGGEDETA